jgi:hypothetical protein
VGPAEIALESRVPEESCGYPAIKEGVVRVPSDVTGASVRSHERNLTLDTGNHAQEVVVGEVTDDDVGLQRQAFDGSEVCAELGWCPIFDEPGNRPRLIRETALEVASADEEQPGVDHGTAESAAIEFGYSRCSSPFAGMDH